LEYLGQDVKPTCCRIDKLNLDLFNQYCTSKINAFCKRPVLDTRTIWTVRI